MLSCVHLDNCFVYPFSEVTQSTFSLMEAINRNGLLFFLLANLLTGLVNVTMDTKKSSPVVGTFVLFSYMFVLSLVSALLHVRDITIRFQRLSRKQ